MNTDDPHQVQDPHAVVEPHDVAHERAVAVGLAPVTDVSCDADANRLGWDR
ncbi:hypothetical protein [Pseudonocardia sp. GCM10023141]|uniref:hypothetical protein n=1 Tax=Pseudonocardia sp. GCM10023141 TaxID=3252653 RepID=UPI00360F4530